MTPRSSIRFFRQGATELQLNIFKLLINIYTDYCIKQKKTKKRNWEILDIFDNINSWWHLSKIKFIPQKDGHCLSFCQIWHRQISIIDFANNISPTLSLFQQTRFTSPNQHAKHWSQRESSSWRNAGLLAQWWEIYKFKWLD